ncbi:2-dehydropantoate 2-reductase [Austwickia chelonae]|uniref:2-dehydropantoate 2-reductase n=1 Tax=Austwickia chelonae TaxID=100225 RepID=UPI000E23B01F|nr:2-dehydropantoate 2-reductase [Austwickia chelonae]
MKFAVIGAGAIGGYYGARLIEADHEVHYLARGRSLAALQEKGIRIQGVSGDHAAQPHSATDDPTRIGPVDAVLLAVKTHQLSGALEALPQLCGPRTAVLTMQNGIEAPAIVAELMGRERVVPCIVRIFTYVVEPGLIAHMGGPNSITLMEGNGPRSSRIEALQEAFTAAGSTVHCPENIWVDLWEKAIFVEPVGALGALAGVPIGTLRTDLRDTLRAAMDEVHQVALASGVPVPGDAVERALALADGQPAESTASLHRDLRDGLPSEMDGQIGGVVRAARAAEVDTPLHNLMYQVLGVWEAAATS